jgi:hypothetical protein
LTNDLQTVVSALRSNPNILTTGIKVGAYSVAYGKLWRGATVIGYLPSAPIEGVELTILNTSHTSPEEAAVFRAPAPPTPASGTPAMSIDSPEGKEAEAPPSAAAPSSGVAPSGEKPPPEIEPGGEEKPPSGSQGAVFKPRRSPAPKNAALGAPRGESFYTEEYAALNEARMVETRRKLLKANAIIEFDLEAKNVTRGVWVHLWLLPSERVDGKFELYTHTVTATCNVPSAYAIRREIKDAMHEQMPHIVVSDASLSSIARKINLAMRGAKDSLGGSQKSESIEDEIEAYLEESDEIDAERIIRTGVIKEMAEEVDRSLMKN